MTQHEPFERPEQRQLEARRLMERYGWGLVTPEALAERGAALLASGAASGLTRALVGAYCGVLYAAFVGEHGPEQQRRACEELGRSLGSLVAAHYPSLPPDERADVVQNALERVWRARESCREPVAFLSFASFHLLSAVQLARRQLRRVGDPLQPPSRDDDAPAEIPDDAPPPLTQILRRERREEIARFIEDLRRARPRAGGQIDILALRWLDDLGYPEIAERLQISPASAHTRLCRILATIRSDPQLLERARDLGLG